MNCAVCGKETGNVVLGVAVCSTHEDEIVKENPYDKYLPTRRVE